MNIKLILSKTNLQQSHNKNTSEPSQKNPYLNARRAWNEHVGSLITVKQTWQFIALISLMINIAAIGGLIHIGSKSKFIPYVVEVDKLGQTMVSGKILNSTEADPRVMHATAAQFIQEIRLVSSDPQVQRQAILNLYAKLADSTPAISKANDFLNAKTEDNPFKRAERELVNIEIRSVIAQTADTWQVEWLETVRDTGGKIVGNPQIWRALVTLYVSEPKTAAMDDNIRRNPLNIFIKDFSWGIVK